MTEVNVPTAPAPIGLPTPILEAQQLRLGYGGRVVLENVNLCIHKRDFWFLIGPNGHGKTTLLLALLGLLRPAGGKLNRHPHWAGPEQIGYVPQQWNVLPTLPTTVREFVGLGLVGVRLSRTEQQDRLAWALRRVGLEGLEGQSVWALSAGQRQRALVARALVRRPMLLLADEPASGLDLSVENALYALLAELNHAEGLTLVVVSHDLPVAARYATHLALVSHGQVTAGPKHKILQSGLLAQAYQTPIHLLAEPDGQVHVRLG